MSKITVTVEGAHSESSPAFVVVIERPAALFASTFADDIRSAERAITAAAWPHGGCACGPAGPCANHGQDWADLVTRGLATERLQ